MLRADLIPAGSRALLASVARVVLVAQRGSLLDQLDRATRSRGAASAPSEARSGGSRGDLAACPAWSSSTAWRLRRRRTGICDGARPGQTTPAPWINVIANPVFGFQVSTEGSWLHLVGQQPGKPAHAVVERPGHRPSGEAFYLRDDDTGDLWSPTALPIRDGSATYVARHGRGYSRFEHIAHGIASRSDAVRPDGRPDQDLPADAAQPLRPPAASHVTAYVEWVLGPSRSATLPFVTTEIDPDTGAMFARNPWNAGFGSRVAFADLGGRQTDWTGDRRSSSAATAALATPAALAGAAPLSNTVGAGIDPCGALRTSVAASRRQCRNRLPARRSRKRGRGAAPDREVSRRRSGCR